MVGVSVLGAAVGDWVGADELERTTAPVTFTVPEQYPYELHPCRNV
jgi:uncharacterized protein (UPF0261 family)